MIDHDISFTLKGRSSRSSMWLGQFGLNVCNAILTSNWLEKNFKIILKDFFNSPLTNEILYLFVLLVPGTILLWFQVSLLVRRIHDLGSSIKKYLVLFSGWALGLLFFAYLFDHISLSYFVRISLTIIWFLPMLFIFYCLFFKRGTIGQNQYGEDPVHNPSRP
ncbi:MAG: hypothetical protein C0412_06825 [Flavobacterium sp.]|nr:hypothetical protein [Flavobacterium sp.]